MSILGLLPMLIVGVGIYFLIKLRFFFIFRPNNTLKKTFEKGFSKNSGKALSLALAGTLGVGNIVGVAYGITVGGAGCLFWIFVSGIFSSVIKYCESTLSASFLDGGRGGMMYVIARSMGKAGSALGKTYSVLCLFLALFMGSALQTKSVADAGAVSFGCQPYLLSCVFTLLIFLTVRGNGKRIENVTAIVIPIATAVYIFICFAVILSGARSLPSVLSEVFRGAMNFKSASGGVLAFLSSNAMKEGFARGLLSNEAGAGTSSIAQCRAEGAHPAKVGLFGMCEVFFDTTLLCTLTGLATLLSSAYGGKSGIYTVIDAFSSVLGNASAPVLFLLIFAFAYSTVVCWYFYASEALSFLFGSGKNLFFNCLFFASSLLGVFLPEAVIILVTDSVLFLMSVLTLLALMKNSERIVFLSEQYGLLKSKHSDVR